MLLQWTSKFISSLAVHRAGTREEVPRIEAKPDDALKLVSAQVGANEAEIFVNEPTKYGWKGGMFGLVAHHWFEILPSPEADGKTLFKHC